MGANASSSSCMPRRGADLRASRPEPQREKPPPVGEAGDAPPKVLLGSRPVAKVAKVTKVKSESDEGEEIPVAKVKSAPARARASARAWEERDPLAMRPALSTAGGASPAARPRRKEGRKVTFGGEEVAVFEVKKMRSIR